MRQLLTYFHGYIKESILGPLLKLLEALLELCVPLIVAYIIDFAIPSGENGVVLKLIFIMMLVAIIGFAFSITAQFFSAKAAVGFTKQLNDALFSKIMRLPQSQVDLSSSSSLVNRMTSDTFQIQTGVNIFFRLFLRSPFIVVGSLLMAMQIDLRITTMFVLMISLLFAIVGIVLKFTSPMYTKVRLTLDRLVQQTQQQIKGIRVIRAFRQESREILEFKETNENLYRKQLKVSNFSALTNPLTYIIVNLTLVAIIWQGSDWIFEGTLTQGGLVALVNYLLQILVELVKLTMVITTMNKSLASARRVAEVLEMSNEASSFENYPLIEEDTLLNFTNVQFKYPMSKEPALDQLNFSINKGEFFGIIGSTGAGKSTLIELLIKNYDATKGTIAINQTLLTEATRESLRNKISIVPQLASLFKGTVRSNLLLGNPSASDEEIWEALEIAQAKDFVEEKDGLDTEVSAFGRNFSGGQRQRLTIARAIIKPAEIYIFDDSTSALDYLTEANFYQAINQYMKHKTIIMVSQRAHSVKNADQILVLNEGQQIGLGTHQQLLENCEVYREIAESQRIVEVKDNE